MNFFSALGLSPNSLRARAGMPAGPAQPVAPVPQQAPQNFAGVRPMQPMPARPIMAQPPMQAPMQQAPMQAAPQNFLRQRMGMSY